MRYVIFSSLLFLSILHPTRVFAWCESDCTGVCRAVSGKISGYKGSSQACIQEYNCNQYSTNSCDPERMKIRINDILSGNVHKHKIQTTKSSLRDMVSINIPYINQETNLCVPISAAMVMAYFKDPHSPREIKALTRGQKYDPSKPFNDFTATYFRDLIKGVKMIGYQWNNFSYNNNDAGFQEGLNEILNHLERGLPVLIDTSWGTGHMIVVTGFDRKSETINIVDPFAGAPGNGTISYSLLKSIWNSTKVDYNMRAAVFTYRRL